ncbi:TFIIB-type zinc ribbon-containing protein [Intestinibacillus sp. Marseille-P6563]|uniref:TFIIB-type zinc ribbon-containing protein n=1 Tax=Intestinibacillus sp. Marseille-P6563 TaxID=2364792 RepID=UPI0013E08589
MKRKVAKVVCPKCGTTILVNPNNSMFTCTECGKQTEIRSAKRPIRRNIQIE